MDAHFKSVTWKILFISLVHYQVVKKDEEKKLTEYKNYLMLCILR